MALKLRNPQFEALTATPERKTYTVLLASVALVVLMVFLAIRPITQSIFDRRTENKDKTEVLSKMDTKYQNLLKLSNAQTERASSFELLDESMPVDRQEEFLIANLKEIAIDADVDVVNINVNRSVTKPILKPDVIGYTTKASTVNIDVRGTRANLINFVGKIESFPKVLNVFAMNISPISTSDTSANIYLSNIQAEFYYYSTASTDTTN